MGARTTFWRVADVLDMIRKFAVIAAFVTASSSTFADPVKIATLADFNYADTRIHTFERAQLKKIALAWKHNSNWSTIVVEGHGYYTDDEASSIALGEARAEHARQLLIDYGVDPLFVKAVGYARPQPGRDVDVTVNER